ncbi:MAG: PulJ/GspJ family protein [Candidatus Loosdrechtia sp.]|uniref:PulJ/GspJ family protein n=1 Tax=Candidatus Loosdrechtia sp. TaxID=3101272 RepID=UPI003A627896|nr:MAG: prepilin-type N-terminal cleavage/methylation domain-containing protein [Candidatus Jettenia sp. AMX2]
MKRSEGFTLFELLIAVFISSMLIMSGAYALRMGLFSLEREESWFNDSIKEKAAFDFFWLQASSLYNLKSQENKNYAYRIINDARQKENFYFIGEKEFLSFVSPLSLERHYGLGMIVANYKIVMRENGKRDLVYSEWRLNTSLHNIRDQFKNRLFTGKDITVFFSDCDMILFEYLEKRMAGSEENIENITHNVPGGEGKDLTWNKETKGMIPQAIKLRVSKHGDQKEIISPIMVMY